MGKKIRIYINNQWITIDEGSKLSDIKFNGSLIEVWSTVGKTSNGINSVINTDYIPVAGDRITYSAIQKNKIANA